MINLPGILHKVRSRSFLIGLALLLLLFNLTKVSVNYFKDQQVEVESRVALLQQQRKSVERIDELRESVSALEARKKALDGYLFRGESEERVASAMQIMLQEMVSKANLDPESLRPILRGSTGEKDKEKEIHDLAIKLRLAGDIQGFLDFLAGLYRSQRLFVIDNFILKPDRNGKLKILMDLKGFYLLAEGEGSTIVGMRD
jgi:Tfp pilus assembly protein PilO